LLAQGTIYPDTIESGGTKNAQTIKTHHNRVPEIEKMIDAGLIVEPLAKLYKDEVREI
jgi:GMP synthase (glutamine-hydrolysing)